MNIYRSIIEPEGNYSTVWIKPGKTKGYSVLLWGSNGWFEVANSATGDVTKDYVDTGDEESKEYAFNLIKALTSSDIKNVSSISGITVTDVLNYINTNSVQDVKLITQNI